MNLTFRRKLHVERYDTASTEELVRWEREYDAFVNAHRDRMPRDLWQYFGYDTFHDGLITRIAFDAACRRLCLHVDCPNVEYRPSTDANFEFVIVSFVVHFEDVHTFALTRYGEETSRNVPTPTFLYGEIETAEDDIREADEEIGERHHSIIVEADVLRFGCVFQGVHVAGAEPAATALMLRDPRFRFPVRK